MVRVVLALFAGSALVVLAAVTVGEYPLSAADIWLAALIVPALVGSIMSAIGRRPRALWVAAGPLAGASVGWGIGISTSWGIEPVPADAWLALAAAALWPIGWGLVVFRPGNRFGSANRQLGDASPVRGSEVGDP
ncbi:MAG TPA: hypothetical protein VMO88_17030 [Acidimicrobiales bacterium]|nr:hypothetical protein [Acidimicrobiales bacterium]